MTTIELTHDDALLVENYGRHWADMGVDGDQARDDWRAEAQRFLQDARKNSSLAAFLAREGDDPVGTAICHVVRGVFPPFRKADATHHGYIWGVYVVPHLRGRGVGGMLVSACMGHLKDIGCRCVLLHAGGRSATLYRRLGFRPTDELSALL
jgi:ribosomal protein S18 acetylase RimI-like enzyme